MKFLILTFFLCTFSYASEMSIYLIEKDKAQSISYQLIGIGEDDVLPSSVGDLSLMGLCLKGAECSSYYMPSKKFNTIFGRMNGVFDVPRDQMIGGGMEVPIVVNNEISTLRDGFKVKSSASVFGKIQSSKEFKLTDTSLKIYFGSENKGPQRKDYSEVSEELKKLSPGVFQIMVSENDDGLQVTGGSGTGFFISEDGYAMTNLHVADGLSECMKNKSCTFDVKFKDDESITKTVRADVLTCSAQLDFCLLKFGPEISVGKYFNIETSEIPEKLLTLGYPGDKEKSFKENESEETCLTYSSGSTVGLNGLGITSSLYISHGASGSPVIDELGNDVFGILSNGTAQFSSSDGMPGLFRPMALIDLKYNLKEYLDGSKQSRVDDLINKLEFLNDQNEITDILNKYSSERTFYGFSRLEELSYSHPDKEIRKSIFFFVKNLKTDF